MSGGYWGYEDRKLCYLAEMLRKEDEPVLAALGILLEDVIEPLHEVDRVFSGDANPDRLQPAIDRIRTVLLEAAAATASIPSDRAPREGGNV